MERRKLIRILWLARRKARATTTTEDRHEKHFLPNRVSSSVPHGQNQYYIQIVQNKIQENLLQPVKGGDNDKRRSCPPSHAIAGMFRIKKRALGPRTRIQAIAQKCAP